MASLAGLLRLLAQIARDEGRELLLLLFHSQQLFVLCGKGVTGGDQLRVLPDGVFERRHQEVENLLLLGRNGEPFAPEQHVDARAPPAPGAQPAVLKRGRSRMVVVPRRSTVRWVA
jgi:hypothetical protein